MNWTIKNLIIWATSYFKDKGIDNSRLDSELLLASILGVERIQLYLMFDKPLSTTELANFKDMVKRRAAREPVAYITGKKEFWSRAFEVAPGVLIPRPETELLTESVLDWIAQQSNGQMRGFEMGTGCGAICITLLAQVPHLSMDCVEIDSAAIEVATRNAKRHNVNERLKIDCCDFMDRTRDTHLMAHGAFDFIVSNPPYVAHSKIDDLVSDIKNFEPTLALDGGEDGLKFYHSLAFFAKRMLNEKGLLAVEIGENQGLAASEIFRHVGFTQIRVKQDYNKLDRVVLGYK